MITPAEIRTTEDCRQYVRQTLDKLRTEHDARAPGESIVKSFSDSIDLLVLRIFQLALEHAGIADHRLFALIATGGYGRGELHPASDIDILLLTPPTLSDKATAAIEKLISLLWDSGLKIGHAVRTPTESIEICQQDHTILTALLDMRLLTGDIALYYNLRAKVEALVYRKPNGDRFIIQKLEEQILRHDKYGSTVYTLQPDIKESKGGLRDLHCAGWIARLTFGVKKFADFSTNNVIDGDDFKTLSEAREFLFRVRNHMHFISGGKGKTELMTFDVQSKLAAYLGYSDSDLALAVENFMAEYYSHVRQLRFVCAYIIERCLYKRKMQSPGYVSLGAVDSGKGLTIWRGSLEFIDGEKPTAESIMEIFRLSQKYSAPIGHEAKRTITRNLQKIDDRFRRSEKAASIFLGLFENEADIYEILRVANETGFLRAYLPEFDEIFCRVQFDRYHVYTVDSHSLLAVKMLYEMRSRSCHLEYPDLCREAEKVEDPSLLYLAVLLHDVGKGRGKQHSESGAEIAADIAERLGLDTVRKSRLVFLVRRHLLMNELAQKRDITDPRLISIFADSVGDQQNLRTLYLLTCVDLMAVNPDIWNSWRASLLSDLYTNASNYFGSDSADIEGVEQQRSRIEKSLSEKIGPEKARQIVNEFSLRFYRNRPFNEAAALLYSFAKFENFDFEYLQLEDDLHEIRLFTKGFSRRFYKVAGVLTANRINIIAAEIYSMADGRALDVYTVTSLDDRFAPDAENFDRIRNDLEQVYNREIEVDALVSRGLKPSILDNAANKHPRKIPTEVSVDNTTSDEWTIIDVVTTDRPSLLYDIARTFNDADIKTDLALVSTQADRVEDSFYVHKRGSGKMTDRRMLSELRQKLIAAIEQK